MPDDNIPEQMSLFDDIPEEDVECAACRIDFTERSVVNNSADTHIYTTDT